MVMELLEGETLSAEGSEDYGILGQVFPGSSLTSMHLESQPGIPQG